MHVQVAAKRAELQGDPNAKTTSKGTGRVADHKSLDMYGAFGSGGALSSDASPGRVLSTFCAFAPVM